jgi:thiamine kinase
MHQMTGKAGDRRPLEEALNAIPDFARAQIVSQLSDGPTNASYLLERAGEQYVLRLDKPAALNLGLNRANEKQVCRIVAAAGLAPEPLFFDPVAGVYLRRYLPGRSWEVTDLSTPGNLQRLARLLSTLHKQPRIGAGFDPLAAAKRYTAQLDSERCRSILHDCEDRMKEINEDSPLQVLCHNDLVCQNILDGKKLMLIDWEYAGIGNPFFDLAVVVRHHGMDAESGSNFLDSYLGRPAAVRELRHLGLQCDFYASLLELWKLRVGADLSAKAGSSQNNIRG